MTTVAIVTYDSAKVIERCLRALGGTPAIVVDNASSDDTVARASGYDHVTVIRQDRNLGFGAAANVAIEACEDNVLLLNPDVVVEAGGVGALEDVLTAHPTAGIVAPALVYADGTVQSSARTFPSPLTMLLRRSWLGGTRVGAARLARHLLSDESRPPGGSVDWVLGAAMLIRREAYEVVGGFDEGFFLYGEDVDLCYRMWATGWEVRLANGVTFVHDYRRQSARTFDLRNRATRAHWRSAMRLYAKHPQLLIGRKPGRMSEMNRSGDSRS